MAELRCLIIGACHSAAQLAASLRQEGWQGSITMIGEEAYLPYNRPPLSKTFLAGGKNVQQLLIRSEAAYEKLDVSFRLGQKVIKIDRQKKQVELNNGELLPYDKLALAVGSRVRKADLPGIGLPGIYDLHDIKDVESIRPYVKAGKKAVIVGGGYVGLETAAMLKKLGMDVTVLHRNELVLNRVTIAPISTFFTRLHTEEGVHIVTNVDVSGFSGESTVDQVNCANGRQFSTSLVVMGIGVEPNVELAKEAGLKVDDGVVVDLHCATSDPDIVAAGDCTKHHNVFYQCDIRLESVQNAVDQAKVAAATLCGRLSEYNALPWFWSDQFDVKLQIAGLSANYDDFIIRGDINNGRKFSVFYYRGDEIIAVDAINSPQEFMLGKRIISAKLTVDKTRLADMTNAMKTLLK